MLDGQWKYVCACKSVTGNGINSVQTQNDDQERLRREGIHWGVPDNEQFESLYMDIGLAVVELVCWPVPVDQVTIIVRGRITGAMIDCTTC